MKPRTLKRTVEIRAINGWRHKLDRNGEGESWMVTDEYRIEHANGSIGVALSAQEAFGRVLAADNKLAHRKRKEPIIIITTINWHDILPGMKVPSSESKVVSSYGKDGKS